MNIAERLRRLDDRVIGKTPKAPTLKSDLIGKLVGLLILTAIGMSLVIDERAAEGWGFLGLGWFIWGTWLIGDWIRRG